MKLSCHLGWLSCVSVLPASVAFTVASSTISSITRPSAPTLATTSKVAESTTQLGMVATTAPIAPADMERGIGGRIEDAFQAAKEKSEAAFVTFITAGYPAKEGEKKLHSYMSYHTQ